MTSHQVPHDEASNCHNCGAAVSYHYCAICGQETTLHFASAGEFIHEFVGHYVALEGRLWKTLRYLLLRPGFLSAQYIAGRRARYVQPLRVYLTFSILFFFVLKMAGPPVALMGDGAANTAPTAAQPAVPVAQGKSKAGAGLDLTIDGLSPALSAKIRSFNARPEAEQTKLLTSAFFSYVPYAMFCLMPLFALYLKLLYLGSGRRYGEHLLFALHANGFAFAMFSILILTSHLHWPLIGPALVLWLLAYLPLAMLRVYGGSRWSTALRWVVLSVLHALSIGAAIVGAFSLAVLA